MKIKTLNQRGVAALEVVLLVIVLALLGYVGYTAYQARQAKPAETKTETAKPVEKQADPYEGWKTYSHTHAKYTVRYPADWSVAEPNGTKPFEDYEIRSADYKENEIGFGDLLKGVSVFIRASDNDGESIQKNGLAKAIGKNVRSTTVNGVAATQYDYTYEGHNATNTEFSKNGKFFLLKYRFTNEKYRDNYLEIYNKILASFEAS